MDEKLKNSSLPEIEKIKLHFIQNPEETVTMTGREFVDHLIEVEKKAVEVTKGYSKADIQKLDRIANAFRDANQVLKAENARLREALERIASDVIAPIAKTIAREAVSDLRKGGE